MLSKTVFKKLAAAQDIDAIMACLNPEKAAKNGHDVEFITAHIRREHRKENLINREWAHAKARARVCAVMGGNIKQYSVLLNR